MDHAQTSLVPDNLLNTAHDIAEYGIGPEHFCSLCDIAEGTIVRQDTVVRLLDAPPILMHGGAFFGIRESKFENAYTQSSLISHSRSADADGIEHYPEADLEARALAAVYRLHGHPVTFMLPQPGSTDGIFCTDSDKTFQKITQHPDGSWEFGRALSLLPVFTHEERQLEVPWKERLLRTTLANPNAQARREIHHMHAPLEFGDTRVVFHKTAGHATGFVLAGIAESNEIAMGRSTQEGHDEFADYLKRFIDPALDVFTIHLRQPFYHMDTAGPNATGGHMFTHPSAYTPESWDLLKQLFGDKLVEIPLEDVGQAFGGNATCFGSRIYISNAISDRAVSILLEHGYDVILTPIPHTMKGGGGHRCMTSVNPHFYVSGGYDLSFDSRRNGQLSRVSIDYQTALITYTTRAANGQWSETQDISSIVSEFSELHYERQQEMDS